MVKDGSKTRSETAAATAAAAESTKVRSKGWRVERKAHGQVDINEGVMREVGQQVCGLILEGAHHPPPAAATAALAGVLLCCWLLLPLGSPHKVPSAPSRRV